MSLSFPRRLKAKVILDLVPMIDIVFQLVIFFMVATTFKTTTGIELTLPSAKSVETIKSSTIKITVKDEENIFIENYKTTIKNFNKVVKNFIIKNKAIKQNIIIYGDNNMKYQLLIDIMDDLRTNGFKNIDLAISKKEYEDK